MSDDGYELDPEEAKYLYGEDTDSHKRVYSSALVMVNKVKKSKVTIELRDENDEKVELSDILDELLTHVTSMTKDTSVEGNQVVDQIIPMMSIASSYLLTQLLPEKVSAMILSGDSSRYGLIYSMSCSFLLLKVLSNKNLKIYTIEEPMTDEEIDNLEKQSKLNEYVVAAHVMGITLDELFEYLKENGKATDAEIEELKGSKSNDN